MYLYLFGIESLRMYDLIGVAGYAILIAFYIFHRNAYFVPIPTETKPNSSHWPLVLLLTVQVVAYTFAGERIGPLVGRSTEFFGYVTISAVGMVLTALVLGFSPLRWLDRTVPLYLTLAATLKMSCFCGGCCYGQPWAYGWFNHRNGQTEFPIQLVESMAYVLLLFLLRRYRGREGQRFALFLAGYAAVRFVVQFFRADVAVFTPFHWMSAVFFGIGAVMWVVCRALELRTDR